MSINAGPERGYPLSLRELRKVMARDPLYDFLKFYSRRDVVFDFDDFALDTINLDALALANSAGTGAANFAINTQANGVIRGTTGTTANGSVSAIYPVIYKGDLNCGMEVQFKVDDPTGLGFEIGFAEAVPAANTGLVNDIDTPTVYGANFAVIARDTAQTLQTIGFVSEGTTAGQNPTKTNCGVLAPVAATWMTVRIQLIGNAAHCWIDGVKQATHVAALAGATLVAPWIYVATRNTTTKRFDVDYVARWQNRA